MTDFYSNEQRALQDQFETRKLAERLVHAIVHTEITPAEDVLPPRDAGRTAAAGGTITETEYEAKIAAGEG